VRSTVTGRRLAALMLVAAVFAVPCRARAADELDPGVARALKRLKSGDDNARHNAALDLANAREKCTPALEQIMEAIARDDNPRVKRNLLRAVGYIGAKAAPAVDRVVAILNDGGQDVTVRAAASFALGKIGEPALRTIPDIIKSGRHSDRNIRQAACRALGEFGPKAAAGVPVIVSILSDGHVLTARQAVVALGDIGPPAIKAAGPLKAKLAGADERMVKSIGLALGKMGPGVSATLLEGAAGENANIRAGCVLALGCVKPASDKNAKVVIKAMADDDYLVKLCALMGLERLGPAGASAVEGLRKALKSGDTEMRWRAASALGAIGPAAKPALNELMKLTDDVDGRVGRSARRAIPKINK